MNGQKDTTTPEREERPANSSLSASPGSQPRLFYLTIGGKKVYLDSAKSQIKREDVVNWSDDGQIGALKNGDVCF